MNSFYQIHFVTNQQFYDLFCQYIKTINITIIFYQNYFPFRMGLEIQPEIFKWLQTLAIVKEGKRNPNNLIELNQQNTSKLFDGIYIGNLLRNHVFKDDQQIKKKLESIKQNSTPAIRLYNWNILTEIMKRLKFTIDYAEKSKILNLEEQPLLKVLKHIYNSQKESDKISGGNPLQVDITQVGKKTIRDSNNILQLFVVSISKNFKLSPQHTLNLFLDNNKYLSHLLVKGVKNSYQPIYAFLNDIKDSLDYIIVTLFCTDEKQSVNFFLNGLKPCIISKDFQVAEKQLQILNDVINTYKMNSMGMQEIKKWMKDDGINTLFFGMKRHPDLFEQILKFTYELIQQQLFAFIQPIDKSVLWANDKEKIKFYYTFLCGFGNENLKKFEPSACCASWYKFCVKIAKKSKDNQQMYLIMKIFEILWLYMPQSFHNQQSDLPNLYLGFLKNASVSNSQLMYNQSVRIMFSLMQTLGDRKNANAPLLYKILTNCFSFHSDETKIAFLADNFIQAFKSINNLPGGPIIDPLIKSLQRDPKLQCLQLSMIMLQQRRITQNQTIQLMEIYTRIVFHDVRYGSYCLQYLFDTLKSVDSELGYEFLQRNAQLSLALYYSICKSITKSVSDVKSDIKRYGQEGLAKRGDNKSIQQLAKHINLGNIVQFLKSAIFFSDELKDFLQPHIFHTYVRISNELKKKKQAEFLEPLLKSYYRMQNQLEDRIKQYEYEQNPPPIIQINDQLPSPKYKGKSRTLIEQQQPKKTLNSSMLKPARSAIKDLEKLRKKKQQIKTLEHKHQKELDMLQSKKQMVRSIINEKRVIQFGSKSKNNMQYNCIFDFDTQKQQENILGLPLIRMLNLTKDIQDPFVQDADSIMKKYRKVWRFLFFKYSTFGAGKKQQFVVEEKINIAQIWKMLKQYEIGIVKKQQSHALVRQVNELMKRKSDLQNLTYLGFQEYLVQLCNYGYGKHYGHVPIGQQIRLFINQLKKMTNLRGGNIDIFENPQEVYFQQTEVIKQFNKRLLQNPQYILPEGYKKIKLNELNYTYEVHPTLQKNISSSYVDVLEVLDEIFSEKLGFRLLEPLTHKMEKYVAKPALFQKLNDKMKDYKGGYLAPKRQITSAVVKQKQEKKIIVKPEFHPLVNFSLGIKMGLANVGIKDRYIADQVAYWVDDMLDAIEKGSNKVENKAKRKIQNEVLKNKNMAIRMLKNIKKQQQQKYKKRAQSVKVQVSQNKKIFQEKQVQKREKRRKQRLEKKAKEERQLKKKVQEFQKAKQKLNEQRQAKKQKMLQQEKAKKVEKQQYKRGVEEYFKKKKQQLQQKQLTLKKTKEDKQQQQKKQKQKKQKMFKNLHYSILKRQEKTLQKVSEVKQVYEDVWQSEIIQKQISNYQLPLKFLFDLLLKHEKSKISATSQDEISLNTIHFFALKFKIVPFMIQKNALVKIFKIVSRISNKSATLGVNFQQFKQLMFRIAVKAKDLLNGIIEKKKKKQEQYSKFFSKQSSDGNHFDVEDISENIDNQLTQSKITKQKQDITDEYLFDANGVTGQTVKQMFDFLSLPRDKQGVQQKYREMLESKNNKPKNILIKELKNSLE